MYRKIVIAASGVGVLAVSLGLGSAALAATGSAVPGKSSAQLQAAQSHGMSWITPKPSHDRPVVEPLTIDQTVVAAGGSVTATGAHCDPGTTVFLDLGAPGAIRELSTTAADSRGAFAATVTIPARTTAGSNTLWAACKAPNPTGKLLHSAAIKITG